MNIEVKKSIEIDVVLDVLEDFKLEAENKEGNVITVERKEMIEILEDTIQIIKVLVKKNKQLRDINKNLSDKVAKKNESIEELSKMCKKLNDQVFELESKVEENKCCCKGEPEKQEEQHDKAKMVKLEIPDMYNGCDMDVMYALAGILLHGLAL